MKNLLATALILSFSLPLFSQRITPRPYSRYDDYLLKSRRKQRAGIILLTAGAVVTAGSTILVIDGIHRNKTDYNDGDLSTGDVEILVGIVGGAIGVASMSTSIPFFVGAHRSRVKALNISLKSERAPLLYKTSLSAQSYPALAFQIPLGK